MLPVFPPQLVLSMVDLGDLPLEMDTAEQNRVLIQNTCAKILANNGVAFVLASDPIGLGALTAGRIACNAIGPCSGVDGCFTRSTFD